MKASKGMGAVASGLAALAVLGATGALAEEPPGRNVLVMPMGMKGDKPVTLLSIAGKGPYLALIDSGDGLGFTLRQEIVEKLDLRQNGEGRVYGVSGTEPAYSYLAHDVLIGGALREPDVAFTGSRHMGAVDAALPIDVLAARPTDLDFEKHEIRLQLSGPVDRTGFRAVKVERGGGSYGRRSFVVHAEIDGIPARLVVDTGASGFLFLDAGFVKDHGLWDRYPHHLDTQGSGVTGDRMKVRMVKASQVVVGGLKFRDPVVDLMDASHASLRDSDGLLGIDFLRRFTVGFDAPASTLWLRANQAIRDPYAYDRSGLTWEWRKDAAFVVAVSGGSPAETAGVRVGDQILGFKSEKDAYVWDDGLQGDPDTEIKFEVLRAGAKLPIKMVLKDWL